MAERTVNARQVDVLNWICDGCPDGVMSGTSYKITAVALQGRRLVKVSKKGGAWRAEPTEAGRYFVKHGAYPAGHWTTSSPAHQESPTAGHPRPGQRPQPPRSEPKVTGLRPVDQMIADLLEAGGEMTVDVALDRQGYWEGLASSATRYNKVPDGKFLKVRRGKSWGQRIITLEDPPAWMTAVLEPIPIAEQLRTPHPVVKALRDDRSRLPLKRGVRARALRNLDAIAKAAQERGYEVAAPRAETGYRVAKGHLKITINGHSNVLDLTELNDRIPHEPTAKELREKERYSWTRIPDHDQVPSGRLRLSLLQGFAVRQDAFSDTKTINLEDRLPQVLQELELRAAAAEERDRRLEQEKQERQRRWEEVREVAKARMREQHRAKTLMSQAERWRLANELDAYLAAMEIRVGELDGEERAVGEEWLAWAREYRSTRLDPLGQPPRMPDDPDFTPDSLAPFMRGKSPYGPGW